MSRIRVAEVFAALSLTTDLAAGVPVEKGLRTCVVATAFGRALGLAEAERLALFHASLLRSIGCTAAAPENAALFVDDRAFQAALKRLDPGDPNVFGSQLAAFGDWAPQRQGELARRFTEIAPIQGPRAASAGCEVSRALGGALGLPAAAVEALDDVYERWDGRGIPGGRRGEELSLLGRVVHVAEQAVFAHAEGGRVAACAEVARRAGGHLDPDLAAAFLDDADALLAVLDAPDMLAAVVAAEPGAGTTVGVAGLSGSERTVLRAAGLVHDLGRAAVSSEVWDRPGPLGTADWERVRLHAYWTDRILHRCPGLAALAELAAAHHERCDGSGYHHGVHAAELPFAARLLAAADVFAAATDTRPYRPAMTGDRARELLQVEAAAGRLDHQACAAVIEGAGLPRPRRVWPCELTDREVEVLRLAARGLSNRGIAAELVVSERTVGHHLTHVYDKTGRRTRAGAAVFAIEHGLLPE